MILRLLGASPRVLSLSRTGDLVVGKKDSVLVTRRTQLEGKQVVRCGIFDPRNFGALEIRGIENNFDLNIT